MNQDKGQLIPFERKRSVSATSIHVAGLGVQGMEALIRALLPDQGNIEVHRDVPMRSNAYPGERRGKLIVVLEGVLRLMYDGNIIDLSPGMVAQVCPDIAYSSLALESGATYLVSRAQARVALHG